MTDLKTTAITAAFLMSSVWSAVAAEKYDIDLKELRPASAERAVSAKQNLEIDLKDLQTGKTKKARGAAKRKPATAKAKVAGKSAAVAEAGGGSYYTMQRGDHLALVLVRHYGMNELEARRLMPEIMRLNSISNPQRVAVGQRLFIPLPASGSSPQLQAAMAAVPAEVPKEVIVNYGNACSFARQLPEKLGLAMAAPSIEAGGQLFAIRHDGLSITVACGIAPAEAITYRRLLEMKEEQLLLIGNEAAAAEIVVGVAERLGLSYRIKQPDGGDQEYLFANPAPGGPDLHLIVKK